MARAIKNVNQQSHPLDLCAIDFFSVVGLIKPKFSSTFLQNLFGYYFNWATVVMILVLVYYISLSISLSIGMALFTLACLYFAKVIALSGIAPLWLVCIIIFTLAWIGQFYGHKIEGKKPSFLKTYNSY